MKFLNTRKAARGFTLIELVIVIAVIAILAALLVPTILGQAERARLSRARGDASKVAMAIARVRTDTSVSVAGCLTDFANLIKNDPAGTECLPKDAEGTPVALVNCQSPTIAPGSVCWGGPYIAKVENDPWNRPYVATIDTTTGAITVRSNGPDFKDQTADDITIQQ